MSKSPNALPLTARCSRGGGGLEAGVVFEALGRNGDDRNLRIAGIDQSLADQAEVVGRTAHAAGLGDGERYMVGILYLPSRMAFMSWPTTMMAG